MMPIELFTEIVGLFKEKIADLSEKLAEALSDDQADEERIIAAEQAADMARKEADEFKQKLTDLNDSEAELINVMNSVKQELTA
jgi:uncharacterized coiled-coil DUF342 family protein